MTDPIPPIERGTLWSRVEEVTHRAEACGALETIETEARVVEEEGISFLVRRVSSLVRKDRARRAPAPENPFLPPESDLTLGSVAPRHVAVLNKFNVLDHHVLIVTDDFRHQEELLDAEDFHALWWGLGEYPSLGFYNGGVVAGASQPHKHLQLVPLPLGDGIDVPAEERLGGAGTVTGEFAVADAPFRHFFARLPRFADASDAVDTIEALYRRGLDLLGIEARPENPPRQSAAYNLLLTKRFLLLVPRHREHFEDVSINALGFAGSLFVRTAEQLDRLIERGPVAALRAVVPVP